MIIIGSRHWIETCKKSLGLIFQLGPSDAQVNSALRIGKQAERVVEWVMNECPYLVSPC